MKKFIIYCYYNTGPYCRIGVLEKQMDDCMQCLDCMFCCGFFSCCLGLDKKKCSNCGRTHSGDGC